MGRPAPSEVPNAPYHDDHHGRVRRAVRGPRSDRGRARTDQHRDAVRLHARRARHHRPAAEGPRPAAAVPHSLGPLPAHRVDRILRLPDPEPAPADEAAIRRVAGGRRADLFPVQRAPQSRAAARPRPAVKLHTKIVVGLVAGAACGVLANALAGGAWWMRWMHVDPAAAAPVVRWISDNVAGPVGQVFLRMLLMTVIPLVFTSITLGVAGIGDIRKVGRVGSRTLAYFLISTALSAGIGLALVNVFQPGAGLPPEVREQLMTTYRAQAQGLQAAGTTHFGVDTFVNMVPRNPIQAAAGMDLLGVIFFSLVFGAALTLIPEERARPLVRVLEAVGDAVVKIIDLAMKLAPYGVFGLIFFTTSIFGWGILKSLSKYVLVVLFGLLLHGTVSLSLLVRLLGGLSPRVFWSRIRASIVTAFSTSSSNATLPTNIAVAEEELKIPPKIAGFVLPLG
ncbi:MAG: hypothetical protein DMD65_11870, partial [Gemmatimonadetes bacterium]